MRKTGKREWSSRDWFWFDVWLVKRVAWFFFDQSQSEVKPEHCNYGLFPTLNENLLLCDLKVYPKDFLEFQKLPLWFRRTMHCQRNSCLFHPASWSWSRKNTPMAGGKVNYRYRDYTYSMYFLFFIYVMSRGGLMIMSLYFRLETLSSRLNEVIVFSLIANLSTTTQCS